MECPLCLDQYSDDPDDYFVTTRNGHIFYKICLAAWTGGSCPACRVCSIKDEDLIRLRNIETLRPPDPNIPDTAVDNPFKSVRTEEQLPEVVEEVPEEVPEDIFGEFDEEGAEDNFEEVAEEVLEDIFGEVAEEVLEETPLNGNTSDAPVPEELLFENSRLEEAGTRVPKVITNANKQNYLKLYNAIHSGNLESLEYLLNSDPEDASAYLNATGSIYQRNGAHLCVQFDKLEILEFLVNCGIDLSARDLDGNTPLDIAIDSGNEAITNYLLNVVIYSGADFNKRQSKKDVKLQTLDQRPNSFRDHHRAPICIFEKREPPPHFYQIGYLSSDKSDYRVVITGKILDEPDQFAISILSGQNTLLHFNHRWADGQTVLSSKDLKTSWTERGSFPNFLPSAIFRIEIDFYNQSNYFLIRVNNDPEIIFRNRIQTTTLSRTVQLNKVHSIVRKIDAIFYSVRLDEFKTN